MAENGTIVTEALVCSSLGGEFEIKRLTVDDIREDELLVRIVASGICHTDFSCADGTTPVEFPFVGGHEGAGVVERIGAHVNHVEVGDHVLLSFSSCGKCAPCRRNIRAYCRDVFRMNFSGSRDDGSKAFTMEDGSPVSSHFFGQSSFARRTVVRAVSAIKIEKSLPLDILCSMGCGMQTGAGTVLNVLRPAMGQTVVIFGAGAVGLAAVMAAKLTPASMVIVVDLVASKLITARELGATHIINANETDTLAQIGSLTDGFGVDRAMDTTGNIHVIKTMIDCAAPGGLVATVGAPRKGRIIEIEPATWLARGISYVGVHQGSSDPQKFVLYLVQLWKDGRFPVDRLVNTFSYGEMREATDALRKGICIKAVLLWDE
ncbi:hypothetical protein DTO166G4_2098 [Paecilomyces variotii]|uniref:S-glutathione dehydrogenase n=1 Tax=Byssochlamys spectabilis TaxID=264951 RepID=A0A443HX45_BYSSP|nr:S-glutathione dehydrogenase [Paecilomyces variotii]KAJ9216166.1 hypothetical protein DTO166G4_2098 [Paecilomyces variotii]KAJ9234262.1 hypothetical protein DTO166G5_5323 [Paecilomyces variotii]KAJ9362621.1 hypothetical protein DTO027B9_298 [Paecilomyces variotii]KAJ9363823.1 hypothetical protein DTO280E4_2045 [Paecilomyces variotii]RWQ96314.1 S-glutathione dehydrogenase [Paecilomyces variotii]